MSLDFDQIRQADSNQPFPLVRRALLGMLPTVLDHSRHRPHRPDCSSNKAGKILQIPKCAELCIRRSKFFPIWHTPPGRQCQTAEKSAEFWFGLRLALSVAEACRVPLRSSACQGNMQIKTKIFLSATLDRVGMVGVLRRAAAYRSGVVLALHRILPIDERDFVDDTRLVLSETAFVSLLKFLRQDYQVVALEDLLHNSRGTDGRPKVAITFDDGWEDTYRVAFPHLLAHGIPATLFVCTALLGTTEALPEETFTRIWNHCAQASQLTNLVIDLKYWGMGSFKAGGIAGSRQLYWSQELKRMPMSARLLLLDHMMERYQVPAPAGRRFMTWEQIRIMLRTGLIGLGSHTSRHATLPSETDHDIRQELEGSRAAIRENTGANATLLAYPNGMHNRRVLDVVRSAGFHAAMTNRPGLITPHSNRFATPRVVVSDGTVTDTDFQLSPSRTSVYFLSSWLRSAAPL